MRAAIYCRVSTEDQVKNLSLSTQENACKNYCQQHGFDVDRVFVEEGESAKTTDRTEFQKMLSYCRENKGRVQSVIVYHTSRFARNSHDHLAVRALLSSYGVSLRSVNEQIDESSQGKFLETVLAAVNQLDNDVRAERSAAGMKAALEKGRWTHKAPIGYLNDTSNDGKRTVIPDSERAALVRKAFDLYATGLHTKQDVLRMVNDMGLRTCKGKRVTSQTFDRLLRNAIYAGVLVGFNGGVRARGNFEPLVSEETFNRVQALLDGKRLSITPQQRNHPEFPLRRFVQCGDCGRPLTGSKSTGRKGVRYSYYHCPKCGKVRERTVDLERQFAEYLERLQPKAQYVKLLNEIVLDTWKTKQAEALAMTTAVDHQLTELRERKDKLVEAFIYQKAIDQDTYQRQLDKLTEEITLAEMAANDAKLEAFDVEAVLNFSEHVILNAARLWTEFSLEQKQRLQRVLFPEGVRFSDAGFGTAATCLIFNLLQQPEAQKTSLAAQTVTGWNQIVQWLHEVNLLREGALACAA